MDEKKFLTPREVASILGVCRETVLRGVKVGRIPAKRIGQGKNSIIRIPKSWLKEDPPEGEAA